MGPAMSIPHLLRRNNLKLEDIDVWEIHEAFAAQMVFNLKCLASKDFAQNRLGLDDAVGEIPMDKLNIWVFSIPRPSLRATGGRLLNTAARRLQEKGGRYAVVSGCAAGGQGSAILLQHPEA